MPCRGIKSHCRRYLATTLALLSIVMGGFSFADSTVLIALFSSMDPAKGISAPWQALTFPNIDRHTEYRAITMEASTVIRAHSRAGASGLIHELDLSPNHYPWLCWRWRIEHTLEKGDLTTKQGDDCAARIYVAFQFIAEGKTLWERFRHRAACVAAGKQLPGSALTYVWANKAAPGAIIDSPYAQRSKMVVVESGNALASQWIDEKRNIEQDYRVAFGQAPPPVMGIAIMTDTDNTGESTSAYYGDIRIKKTGAE
ncbi:MAG: DUF3047 domain-containing protein [Desulfobacteraceae bacterium]